VCAIEVERDMHHVAPEAKVCALNRETMSNAPWS
jgi:hypothetical protein